jgi:protein phosphatase
MYCFDLTRFLFIMLHDPLAVAILTHPGRIRRKNQDACAADAQHGVFVVCDGVGGIAGGEIASRVAGEAVLECVAVTEGMGASGGERLARAAGLANERIYQYGRQNRMLRGMGTTLVALLVEQKGIDDTKGKNGHSKTCWGTVWVSHVGDSRCYRFRGNSLEQLTYDHSVVEEQVRAGEMTREQAERSPIRNVITRAVGSQRVVDADIASLPAESGDLYLLATDGLTRELSDEAIAAILRMRPEGVEGTQSDAGCCGLDAAWLGCLCEALVEAALERGGRDNITCVLVSLH